MRISENRSITGSPQSLVTEISRTWEGVEVVFGGVYTLTMGRAERLSLRERIDSAVDSNALL